MVTIPLGFLYKFFLISIANSPLSLIMNYYFIKYSDIDKRYDLNNLKNVDQILKAPQVNVEIKESQMSKAIRKNMVNVAIVNDKAYWVKNNILYCSSLDEDGDVNISEAEEVDVFSMSQKELRKLLSIIDSLNK